MRVRMVFDEIAVKARRVWKDENGKRRTQVQKFWKTQNPFNVDAYGVPKSREVIWREVCALRDAWIAEAPVGEKREPCA